MQNLVFAVGRLVSDPEIKEAENNRKVATITVAIPRSYKNSEGIYETDFISVILWNGIAERTFEYCKKGDLVGIKGRMQKSTGDKEMVVIAEKISFLASKKTGEENEMS